MRIGMGMAATALAAAILSAQEPPSDPIVVTGPDEGIGIDMTGPVPVLRGGAWRFRRTGTLIPGAAGQGQPFTFDTCLAGDTLPTALRRLAGERSNQPLAGGLRCGTLRLDVARGRIRGRRSCTQAKGAGQSHSSLSLRLSGQYEPRRLQLTVSADEQTVGLAEGGQAPRSSGPGWRVTGERTGGCEAANHGARLRPPGEAAELIFGLAPDGTGI